MKYTKKKNYEGSIRKVLTNDKSFCYGIVGTVKDLLQENILTYCDYDSDTYCFIGANNNYKNMFGHSKEEATKHLEVFE